MAALALDDTQYAALMCVTDVRNPPEFYARYVENVRQIIRKYAEAEFECLWREHKETGVPLSALRLLV